MVTDIEQIALMTTALMELEKENKHLLELLREAQVPPGEITKRIAMEDWLKKYENWYKEIQSELYE